MKKVLVLNGSPKAKSDTMVATSSFIKAMQTSAEFDVEIIDLIKLNIKPCRGCFACWGRNDAHCIQIDDQNALLDKYVNADIIIYSFPLYCYAMPSHVKAFVDRLLPLGKMAMKEIDGRLHHVPLVDMSKKKMIFIIGSGFPNFEGNFESIKLMIKAKFGSKSEIICVSEAPAFNQEEAKPVTIPLLKKFESAGEYFSKNMEITYEMKKELETPMIPNEEYIKIVNSQRH